MQPCQNVQTGSSLHLEPNGAHGVIALPVRQRFSDSRFSLISPPNFCYSQKVMRLLAELLIIVALIFLGWNTPFNQYAYQAKTKITSVLDGLGGSLQKNQDKSVKRY